MLREQRSLQVRNHQPESCVIKHMTQHCPGRRPVTVHHLTYCVGDIIDHDGGLGPPVVHGCQAVIPFLSCSVPDLKLDCCVIQTYCLCEEGSWKDMRTCWTET